MPSPTDVAQFLMNLSGRPVPGRIYGRYKFVLVFLTVIIFDSLLLMIVKWHDVKLRLFAFEDLLINAYILFVYIYFALNPVETTNLMEIIQRRKFTVEYKMSRRQIEILGECDSVKQRTMKILLATVVIYHSCNCFMPGIIGTIQILNNRNMDSDMIESLPLAFESLYPLQFMKESLYPYYTIITIQNICIIGEALVFGAWSLLAILAYVTIETELELLIESLKDIDGMIKQNLTQPFGEKTIIDELHVNNSLMRENATGYSYDHSEAVLKSYIRTFVVHHQSVIRGVKEVHRSTNFLTFMLNQIVCCQVCVSLYSSFSVKGIFLKCRSVLTVLSVLGNFGLFCLYGQSLIDKSNNLKFELMACSWIDRPLWFKKSLCIITMRCDWPLQIKPLGLYILNMQNFCKVLNASYSYFNFLHKFKKD